jgi:hypothetical protein
VQRSASTANALWRAIGQQKIRMDARFSSALQENVGLRQHQASDRPLTAHPLSTKTYDKTRLRKLMSDSELKMTIKEMATQKHRSACRNASIAASG